jgi:hypothetical protein
LIDAKSGVAAGEVVLLKSSMMIPLAAGLTRGRLSVEQ